ncbi:MAG TPA: TIGR02206 family membrane protein [Anaeromyxobacteraceae bacterium]|nr:TIGR02206 family membrane protein [Anaeromyxobacteraceae bacterium]
MAPGHLVAIALVPLLAFALSRAGRRGPRADRAVRLGLAAALALNELAWYAHVVGQGWVDPPFGLPLDLCDLALWGTVLVLVRELPRVREVLYYLALAGTGMAVLTPDLGPDVPAYVAARFFVAHGGIVTSILYLVLTGAIRPGPGSWLRALLWVNLYALAIGLFDWVFGTNYFYLREKPAGATLLDWLGPWPWYIVAGEVVAAALFFLLSLPFRTGGDPATLAARSRATREPAARADPGDAPHRRDHP